MSPQPKLTAAATVAALLAVTGCRGEAPYELVAGMPEYPSYDNVYSAAGAGMLADQVRDHPARVYVPSFDGDEVYVIDQQTFEVVEVYDTGPRPRHIMPAYDLGTLYVAGTGLPDGGLLAIDPATSEPTDLLEVPDVNILYFSPDGEQAIAVAEHFPGLDFYDATSWEPVGSLELPECEGVSYLDYSADGRVMVFSCAVSGDLLRLDSQTNDRLGQTPLGPDALPQDVRLTPDGEHFLVADMRAGGVHVLDADASAVIDFVPTGDGAHAIYFSRDATLGYVVNRTAATVTVLQLDGFIAIDEWQIPDAGLELGGLNADGSVLWLAGGDRAEVYAVRTADGELLARVPVGEGPYSLLVWPQPGRYSLGNTSNIR